MTKITSFDENYTIWAGKHSPDILKYPYLRELLVRNSFLSYHQPLHRTCIQNIGALFHLYFYIKSSFLLDNINAALTLEDVQNGSHAFRCKLH